MKRTVIPFCISMLIAALAVAGPVTSEQARTAALNFMSRTVPTITKSSSCQLAYTFNDSISADTLLYIFNVDGGFVVVAADDAVTPILGYSPNGHFNSQNIPDNCRMWLQGYADQIAYVRASGIAAVAPDNEEWADLLSDNPVSQPKSGTSVDPLLTTEWGGLLYSPFPGSTDEWYAVGSDVAMAQIINYHQWPPSPVGSHQFYLDELSIDTLPYQFSLMPDDLYSTYDTAQLDAVRHLMRDCAIASNTWEFEPAVRAAFNNHFRYKTNILQKSSHYVKYDIIGQYNGVGVSTYYSDSLWKSMLKSELDAQRPIYYSAQRFMANLVNHSNPVKYEGFFVCDGYDANDYFHFNWGWDGDYNGFFKIDSMVIDSMVLCTGSTGYYTENIRYNSHHVAIFLTPDDGELDSLLFNVDGITTETVSQPTLIAHSRGLNDTCFSPGDGYYLESQMTLYPQDSSTQLLVELIEHDNTTVKVKVYDGPDTNGTLLATINNRSLPGIIAHSTNHALTLLYEGQDRHEGVLLRVSPTSNVPIVRNLSCVEKDVSSATLAWEVFQREHYTNYAFNWQLEYGLQGFTLGTGTVIHPADNDSSAILNGLEVGEWYDAYLTYTYVNGETVTLDPITFKTYYMADCYDPVGDGVHSVNSHMAVTGYHSYSMAQQIFTVEELVTSGLSAGDAISTLWLQYGGSNPLIRTMRVYMGQTSKTAFENNTDWFALDSLLLVFPDEEVTFANTNPDYWCPLRFETPFVWDGQSNLVVAFSNNSGTYFGGSGQHFFVLNSTTGLSLWWEGDNEPFSTDQQGLLTTRRANIKLCAATSCVAPTGLTDTVLSRTEVQLNWNRMYQEDEWTVEYGLSGFEHGSGDSLTVTGNPTALIGGLEGGFYDFYVRANCGIGNYSNWRKVSAHVMGVNDCIDLVGTTLSSGALVAYPYCNYSRSQQIFSAAEFLEMGMTPGEPIYSLSVQYNNSATLSRKMSIYMANTYKTAFADNSEWFNLGSLTNVFTEKDFTFDACGNDESYRWVTFNFDTPFFWDGVSNVVVAFTNNSGNTTGGSSNRFNEHTGAANNTLSWSDNELPSSSSYGSKSNKLSNIRFCAGCMFPTHITALPLSRHEVRLAWQPAYLETEWRVEYGPAGFEHGSGTLVTVDGTPELTVSQLRSGVWDFYLQSDCSDSANGPWTRISVQMGDEETDCVLHRTVEVIVNEGDSYDFYGRSVSEQGTYTHRMYANEECDSVITLNLTVRKIFYVTPTGAGTHSGATWQNAMELQEAMDAASSYTNATPFIYVKKGTYTGNATSVNCYEIKPNVRVYGGLNGTEAPDFDLNNRNPNNISTLNGNNVRRVLYQNVNFTEATASVIDGFTIRGGAADSVGEGGAVYLRKYCTLRNCVITANNASIGYRKGVAVFNNGGTLENCDIHHNSVTLSGNGTYTVRGVGVYSVEGIIKNCTIRNNTTVFDNTNSNLTVEGGGLYLYKGHTVTGCRILQNSASKGGGVFVGDGGTYVRGYVTFTSCVISNNTARSDGGGVNMAYFNGDFRTCFNQCLIGNNTSETFLGGGVNDKAHSIFINCDIVRNYGGGIRSSSRGTTLNNSIVWGNSSQLETSSVNGVFNIVNSAISGSYSGAIPLEEENSGVGFGYPNFTNPTAEAGVDANNAIGDWTLQPGSACIGMGRNDLATTETDLAGNPRIQQGNIDIGAYESAHGNAFTLQPEAGSNIIYVTTTGAGQHDGSSWGNATSNLQYAMFAAMSCNPPATIWMAQGTYTLGKTLTVQPGVAVYGSFVGNEPYTTDLSQRDFINHATILDGDSSYRVLNMTYISADPSANSSGNNVLFRSGVNLFDGITVQRGISYEYGGAYLNQADLLNCTFRQNGNKAAYVENAEVRNCTFVSNTGAGLSGSELNVSNCTFTGNTGIGISGGDNSIIANCLMENNGSTGAFVGSNGVIKNCIVRNNGAGIRVNGNAQGGTVRECIVSGNGGVGISSTGGHVFNTTVINNRQGINASGGLYANVLVANNTNVGSTGCGGVYAYGSAQFINCNIVNNKCTYHGQNSGGVLNASSANQFINCVIWGNKVRTQHANVSGTAIYTNCAVEGGISGSSVVTSLITLDTLNIGSDPNAHYPHFVFPSDTAGNISNALAYDWHLGAGSACINQGVQNASELNLPALDLDGSPRIKQGRIDIGAYEYGEAVVQNVQETLCLGEDFYYGEYYYYPTTPGLWMDTILHREDDQDQVVCLAIQTNPVYDVLIDTAICEGETYLFNGELLTETAERALYLQTAGGCDSTITLALTVLPHAHTSVSVTACDSYTWNDSTYYESGEYQQIFAAANGCDSIVTLNLTINHSDVYEFDQTACVVYMWNGISYRQSGDYTQTFLNQQGCDSIVTMHLTILDILRTEFSATACDSYTWNGEIYTTGGDKVQYFESSLHCDSIVTLHLTLNHSVETTQHLTACDIFQWNDSIYTQSGTYQQHFTATNGCDSTVTLFLTVNHSSTNEVNIEACEEFVWNNVTYNETGDYTQTLTSVAGCDSVVTLHLTIHHGNSFEFSDNACVSYIWNGATYTQSGDYQQTFTNVHGCDSVVTLHLNIVDVVTIEIDAAACESYTWNDSVYTQSGQYQQSFTAIGGCDSVVTLNLTINPSVTENVEVTAYDNYTWNDMTYNECGIYTQTLTNINGCDSVVTLHLTLMTNEYLTLCENELPYTYYDTVFDVGTPDSSIYSVHLTSIHGFDSIVELHVTVIPAFTPEVAVSGMLSPCVTSSATITANGSYSSYLWSNGETSASITVTTPGSYWVTAIDANGCHGVSEPVQLGLSELITETPAICMVGVENNHNLVVWEELSDPDVVSYQIYRENDQANVFDLLTVIPAGSPNAYEDVTADPSVRAWRYKITAADSCGGETPMSAYHKTVHLTINQGIGNSWNLIWTPYEGFEFASYKLYRGTASNNLQLIQTMPATLTSFTDNNPAGDALFYQIEVVMAENCVQHTRDMTYTGTRSNIVWNGVAVTAETTVAACESYDWNGEILTASGDYVQTLQTEQGYDSTVTLHLIILQPTPARFFETACESYTWTNGNGQTYTQSGTYTHAHDDANGCTQVDTLFLTIMQPPAITIYGNTTITAGESTILTASNNNSYTYLWNTGQTGYTIVVSPTETTTYTVTVYYGPCSSTASVTVIVNTGIDDHETQRLVLYPNPTSGKVVIDRDNVLSVEVFDKTGRLLTVRRDVNEIDLGAFADGIYTLRISLPDGVVIRKVIKAK